MYLDLASFAFGCRLLEGTGTSPWGTSLGQSQPAYKFTAKGYENILAGMVYNAVPLKNIGMPLGRGGNVVYGNEHDGIQLSAVFRKVYVNGQQINAPFSMVIFKEDSLSHAGRRHLKYSPKMFFKDSKGYIHSNADFLAEVHNVLHLADNACWFVYAMEVLNLDELHLSAIIVNTDGDMVYKNSKERAIAWRKMVEKAR